METTSDETHIVVRKVKTGGTILTKGYQITIRHAGVCPSAMSDVPQETSQNSPWQYGQSIVPAQSFI